MTEPQRSTVTDRKTWKSNEMENSGTVVYLTKTCPQKDMNISVYSSFIHFNPNLQQQQQQRTK